MAQFRYLTAALLALLAAGSGVGRAGASDWVEEPVKMPPIAPQRAQMAPLDSPTRSVASTASPSGTGANFLTGSATRFGKTLEPEQQPMQPFAPGRPMTPQFAPQQPGPNFMLDARQFVAGSRKDQVVPPDMMKGWLDQTHPEFRLNAQANPGAVLEIRGAWDNAGQILDAMRIPHQSVKPKELRDITLDPNMIKVMVINCEGKIPEDCIEKVRRWVIAGGYLISTDWTLHSFLERAFPGMLEYNKANTPGSVVDAVVVDRDPSLFKGLPAQMQRASWKLDDQSEMVRVLRPDVVRVLAHSWQLANDDPNRNMTQNPNEWGVLAAEFQYGRGKVLHLVGHYDYNSPPIFARNVLQDAIPGVGVGLRQAISTNFLIEALCRSPRTNRSSSGAFQAF